MGGGQITTACTFVIVSKTCLSTEGLGIMDSNPHPDCRREYRALHVLYRREQAVYPSLDLYELKCFTIVCGEANEGVRQRAVARAAITTT